MAWFMYYRNPEWGGDVVIPLCFLPLFVGADLPYLRVLKGFPGFKKGFRGFYEAS